MRTSIMTGGLVILIVAWAAAATPTKLNYQGRLSNPAGEAVADGNYSVTLTLYDAPVGGVSLWTETQSVATVEGFFSIVLGSVNPILDTVFSDTGRYLGITVGADPELTPRAAMVTVPFSFRIATVDGSRGGSIYSGVAVYPEVLDTSGNAIEVRDNSGDVGLRISARSTGIAQMDFYDPVDSKDGASSNATGPRRVSISPEGIYVFGASGTDTVFSVDSIGDIRSSGQIAVGETASNSGAYGTAFGFNPNASGDSAVVSGGTRNEASGAMSTVSGGRSNVANAVLAVIAGGDSNTVSGIGGVIGGGRRNFVAGDYSAILGGQDDSVFATADRSYLFGINSKLTEDSTFMVHMPHIRFGSEATGYEFPPSDGAPGDALVTDGGGTVSWQAVGGGSSGWTDDGTVLRLDTSTDSVGIGTAAPTRKLEVAGSMKVTDTVFTNHVSSNSPLALHAPAGSVRIYLDDATGNVGVGTSTPAQKLDVSGTVQMSGLKLTTGATNGYVLTTDAAGVGTWQAAGSTGWTDGGTKVVLNTSTDSVGIGTATPTAKLEVTGDTKISGKATIGTGHTNTGASAFVAGLNNTATASFTVVGGGNQNAATADRASVGGGALDTASGINSSVGGGYSNAAAATGSTISGGSFNRITSAGDDATIGGGRMNTASGLYATVGGGQSDTASSFHATVGGGYANKAVNSAATVAGGSLNVASGNSSTVGGGSSDSANGRFSTVSGGSLNVVNADSSSIGGGIRNYITSTGKLSTISGGFRNYTSGRGAAIGGGSLDTASGNSATIGGGQSNFASGDFSTISGGQFGRATGPYSTVPGGLFNEADKYTSFASGLRARARHAGCFVFADSLGSSDSLVTSGVNQFLVRSSGGATFYSNQAKTTGVTLAAGGGSWANVSDRNVKENIESVDGSEILDKLADIPISEWNYISQDDSIRHIGPMAQDFYEAFGIGEDNRHITGIDADGVALAAIKALHAENKDLKKQLAEMKKLLEKLSRQIEK